MRVNDIYPIEYMCTKAETVVTTINIVADKASKIKAHFVVKIPETIQSESIIW